jgi:hypothetical protein
MKEKKPYWYKLIKAFKDAPPPYSFKTGLTIPMLYGAYEVLESSFKSIEQLIKSIIDSEADKYPIIHRCPAIGKHVILVEDKADCNRKYVKYSRIESNVADNMLLISDTAVALGKTFEKLCHSLNAEYWKYIMAGEYSWKREKEDRIYKWQKFDEQELSLITNIIKKHDAVKAK